MKMYLTRHTQTNYNVDNICNADPSIDVHLTELGFKEARELAQKLSGVTFEAIFISEFNRTKQTADSINESHGKPIFVDKRLDDNDAGYEGLPGKDWKDALYASDDPWNAKFNGGESLFEVRARVRDFLIDLSSKDYERVLVVTHGWIIKLIYSILTGATFEMTDVYDIQQGDYGMFDI